MKTVIKLLLLFLLSTISASAQVVEISSTRTFPTAPSGRELSCSNNDNYVVTYFTDTEQETTTHQFLVEDKNNGTKKTFALSGGSTQLISITDMAMSGDVCYFCGRAGVPRTPVADETEPTQNLMSKGFVGYFDASLVMLNAREYFILTVDGTYTLSRIAANNADGSIMAIGIPESQSVDPWGESYTCVVGLLQESTHNWTYDIEHAIYGGEYLRDITYCGDGYLMVSEFADDDHAFGVRYVKRLPLSEDTWHEQICRLYKFNTQSINTYQINCHLTQRNSNSGLFINNLTVAHTCENSDRGLHGVALYHLDPASMFATDTLMMDYAMFAETAPDAKLLDIADYLYFARPNSQSVNYVSMLLNDTYNGMYLVQRAAWIVANRHQQNALSCLNSAKELTSLSTFGSGKYLQISGHSVPGNMLTLTTQHYSYANTPGQSCLDNNRVHFIYRMSTVKPTIGNVLDLGNPYSSHHKDAIEHLGIIGDISTLRECGMIGNEDVSLLDIENPTN